MFQRKWMKITKKHHIYTLNSFWDEAEQLLSEILDKEAYKEQYQYLCETAIARDMKASDWVNRLEVMNECLPLIIIMTDRLSEREPIRRVITPNIPKAW